MISHMTKHMISKAHQKKFPMFATLKAVTNKLIDLCAIIGAIGLLFVTLIILIDVIGRAFGYPLTGAQDISQMGMVIIVFGAMALCDRIGGHIIIDIFETSYSARLNHWMDVFSALLGTLIFAAMAWTIFEAAKLAQMLNLATNIIFLPKAYFQWILMGFAALTSVSMALRAFDLIFHASAHIAEKEQKNIEARKELHDEKGAV